MKPISPEPLHIKEIDVALTDLEKVESKLLKFLRRDFSEVKLVPFSSASLDGKVNPEDIPVVLQNVVEVEEPST